jgi:hypothetical protein
MHFQMLCRSFASKALSAPEFTTPWRIFSQVTPRDRRPLLDDAEYIVPYHYIADGRMTAQNWCRRVGAVHSIKTDVFRLSEARPFSLGEFNRSTTDCCAATE